MKFFKSLSLIVLTTAFVLYFAAMQGSRSGVACSVPNTFTNGSTADATQVNANFSALVACFANTAESGANSSITALTGLTTPISNTQGGTPVYRGTLSTGTNAIVVAQAFPGGFTLTSDYVVVFPAGFSNTGATTLNVAGSGAVNLYRQLPAAPGPMVGGEIVAGQMVAVTFDGAQWQLISTPPLVKIPGEIFDYAGASGCPVGSLEANGGSFVVGTYPALNTVLGTTWGVAGTLPDLRGGYTISRDQGGSTRISSASSYNQLGSGGNGSTNVGAATYTTNISAAFDAIAMTQARLPNITNLSGTFTATNNISGHIPTGNKSWAANQIAGGGGGIDAPVMVNPDAVTDVNGYTPTGNVTNISLGGSATPFSVMGNSAVVIKCVKL